MSCTLKSRFADGVGARGKTRGKSIVAREPSRATGKLNRPGPRGCPGRRFPDCAQFERSRQPLVRHPRWDNVQEPPARTVGSPGTRSASARNDLGSPVGPARLAGFFLASPVRLQTAQKKTATAKGGMGQAVAGSHELYCVRRETNPPTAVRFRHRQIFFRHRCRAADRGKPCLPVCQLEEGRQRKAPSCRA